MKIEAIIFDKDGTLLDFDAFWISVSVKALEDVLAHYGMQQVPMEALLAPLGVRDGVTDPDGILCKGTYGQIGQAVYDVLCQYGFSAPCRELVDRVTDSYSQNAHAGQIRPTCPDLAEVLGGLKDRGLRLAVVTTDNREVTEICLKTLGIYQLFDKIYTDDGNTPVKPDPACALDFMNLVGADKGSTLMVGDTLTDVRFARNAGIKVLGVAKTPASRTLLQSADRIISDPSELPSVLSLC